MDLISQRTAFRMTNCTHIDNMKLTVLTRKPKVYKSFAKMPIKTRVFIKVNTCNAKTLLVRRDKRTDKE